MSERVLGYSVPVHVEGKPSVSYPAGTPESSIPEEHLAQITNPKAWDPSPLDVEDENAALARGIVLDEDEEIPDKLKDCTEKQLRRIAEREQIPLGRVRSKGDIIDVLREAGVEDGE